MDTFDFMIASTGSGRGKTTITVSLLSLFKENGYDVRAFKCGPDYIDPMFHRDVLKIPSTNLDSFFLDDSSLNALYRKKRGAVNIIESAMGLYDGKGASGDNSAYEIASTLNIPIILVIDAYGMGYSILAEILGFLSLDENELIKGIILNRISEKFYNKISPVLSEKLQDRCKILGFVNKMKDVSLKSRHLGLMSPEENSLQDKLKIYRDSVKGVYNSILSSDLFTLDNLNDSSDSTLTCGDENAAKESANSIRIAVAKDEAFSFIYEENIDVLKELGAEIINFSPIHDKEVPQCDALILYGGYPENYLPKLSSNESMLKSIRDAISGGVKTLAECGGYMYLLDEIEHEGNVYKLASVIKGRAYRTNGLVRFGYVDINVKGNIIKGHEFHHFEVDTNEPFDENITISSASNDENYKGFITRENLIAGFPHLYYLSYKEFVKEFIKNE
ncbi:MAG: cobyrinate a,c-diamide synthase [Lachnospiraceae bacterium]|nr:cobyrinate a,c-diamide synthase [Lachnospiraceae bacterium]